MTAKKSRALAQGVFVLLTVDDPRFLLGVIRGKKSDKKSKRSLTLDLSNYRPQICRAELCNAKIITAPKLLPLVIHRRISFEFGRQRGETPDRVRGIRVEVSRSSGKLGEKSTRERFLASMDASANVLKIRDGSSGIPVFREKSSQFPGKRINRGRPYFLLGGKIIEKVLVKSNKLRISFPST